MTVRIHSLLAQLDYLEDTLSSFEVLCSAEAPPRRNSAQAQTEREEQFQIPISARSQVESDIPLDSLSIYYEVSIQGIVAGALADQLQCRRGRLKVEPRTCPTPRRRESPVPHATR